MATYFISDIHGEYELFIKLLKEIDFNNSDSLYICGDMIDKGKDSIKLIKFISEQENIFAIMGNHEYYFCKYIEGLRAQLGLNNLKTIAKKIKEYFPYSSEEISLKEIEYIFNLPYYIETDDFICVHAGLEVKDNKIIPLKKQEPNYMLFNRSFKDNNFEPINKPILFGHTPCFYDKEDGRFIKDIKSDYSANKFSFYSKIRLDTGVSYTKMLGVLRKEDMKEFYVNV